MVRRVALCALLLAGPAAARAAPDFRIEVEVAPSAVYVGGEAILRQRLLRAPGVPYGVVRPPVLGDAAEVWPLERLRWYEAEREGVTWQVHERSFLILPRRVGSIEVQGSEIEGPLRHAQVSGEKGRGAASGSLRGPSVRLEVRAPPAEAGDPWLPARSVTLEESWSQDLATLSVGAPVTRTVTIRVSGLPAKSLPLLPKLDHPALRVHHDSPELATEHRADGTIGRMLQRVVLVALDEAEVVLPEFSVRWWDVTADVPRVATLAARTLRLQAPAAPAPAVPAPVPGDPPHSFERMGAAAFALLLAAWLWWHARTHAWRDARRKLRQACLRNDARAARDALAEWWSATRPGRPAPLGQRIGEAWDADARAELWALDAALYARRAWDGKRFWRRVRPWLRRRPRQAGLRLTPASFFRLQVTDVGALRRD